MNALKWPVIKVDRLLAVVLLLTAAVVGARNLPELVEQYRPKAPSPLCEKVLQPKAEVNSEQLGKLLTVAQPSKRSKVEKIVKKPYCQMPSLSFRAGAKTERHAYPLASDPQMWVVVLYEGDNYVGYGFKRD